MNESAAAGVTTESQLKNYYRWAEPESDITVLLRLETVDRLQLEVLCGTDSFSHAENEVGGILLGRTGVEQGRTLTFVDDFEPVPCEHRNGPSYALTGKDALNFEAALERAGARQISSVVGYYRSHNRGGLFLSQDDLRLIHRHFRGRDNLFLLIKTMPSRACTAGFFFWKDGHLRSEFTDSEAPLIPISLSSAGRSFSRTDAEDDGRVASAAPVPPDPRRSRRQIFGMLVIGAAAAVAVISYRGMGPARHQTPDAPHPVPVAVAKSAAPAPTPVQAPASVTERSDSIPNAPKTVLPPAQNTSTPPAVDPKPRTPAPVLETAAVLNPAESEPGMPPSPQSFSTTTGRPLNPAPPNSADLPMGPPVPVTSPPISENPVGRAMESLRPVESVPVVPPVSTPAPPAPAASGATHTFVGPQIIHQVTPAVPRGVGPMITADVQVDVSVAIDINGKVTGARVVSTKGTAAGLLTIQALKAAQLFRFQPAQEDGRNVASSMVLTFRFARTSK